MSRRERRKEKKKKEGKVTAAIKKIGTLNLVLILVGLFFLWFNWQMIQLFRMYGNLPETYACAVVGATIGEAGICGWIRTTKDRHQDRKWQKEDSEKEMAANQQIQDMEDGVTVSDESLTAVGEEDVL